MVCSYFHKPCIWAAHNDATKRDHVSLCQANERLVQRTRMACMMGAQKTSDHFSKQTSCQGSQNKVATSWSAIFQQASCPQLLGYQLEKERFSRRSQNRMLTHRLGEALLPGLNPRAIPSPGRHLVHSLYWAELDGTNHSIIYWLPRAHRLQRGRANLNWPYRCKLNRTTHPSKQSVPLEEQAWVILLQL